MRQPESTRACPVVSATARVARLAPASLAAVLLLACAGGGPAGGDSAGIGPAGGGPAGGGSTGDGAAAGDRAAAAPAVPNAFAADALWDDGKAEINAYEAVRPRYGVPRRFTAYHVVVKEDFSRRQLVKADPGHDPADLLPVLKLNQVHQFQTGIYAYHQMASTFHERVSMDLVKFTLASFEWCGNSFKEYTRRDGEARLHVHTYWDGMADATYDLPADRDVVLLDQLPLWIRSLPQTAGASFRLRLVPGQFDSRGPRPEIAPATLVAVGEEPVEVPAGTFPSLRWEIRPQGTPAGTFWVGREFPHRLVAMDHAGSVLRLIWSQRLAYWELNRPEDARYLQGPPGRPAPPTGP